jgi:UDP-N-acetylmuramyl pentapeptide synthase
MKAIPFSTKLITWIAKKFLAKFQEKYFSQYNAKLPIILVAGTAGKSSMTLLLKQLFEANNWKVYSGASKTRCLNSVTGLVMTIGGFVTDFEGSYGLVNKVKFVFLSAIKYFSLTFDEPQNTILIYEIGFNEQHDAEKFCDIFADSVDTIIITNLTYEHSFGFEKEFDENGYLQLKPHLPKVWQQIFENPEVESRLKNIALEQCKLIRTSRSLIMPTQIGLVDNMVLNMSQGEEDIHELQAFRGDNFQLKAENKYNFSSNYLFPITFAKVSYQLEIIQKRFGLADSSLPYLLENLNIPNGRFSKLDAVLKGTIIDSTYNSDPASLSGFLDLFEEVVTKYSTADFDSEEFLELVMAPKHYLILGEMRELGETSIQEHSLVLTRLKEIKQKYEHYIEGVYLIGQEWLKCDEQGFSKKDGPVSFVMYKDEVFKIYDRAGDINSVLTDDTLRPQSWYWVKGSQNTIFLEIVVEHLLRNKNDVEQLCRRGEEYDEIRTPWR